jgi:phage shock protein A
MAYWKLKMVSRWFLLLGVQAVAVIIGLLGAEAFVIPASSVLRYPDKRSFRSSSLHMPVRPPEFRRHTFALKAGILDRAWRAFRSQLSNLINFFEDPAKIIEQALIDMDRDVRSVRQAYAEVAASQQRTINERDEVNKKAAEYLGRAELALKSNRDELARHSLSVRQGYTAQLEQLNKHIETLGSALSKMKDSMVALELKADDLRREKDSMIARYKTARSSLKVNELLEGLNSRTSAATNSMGAFSSMKEKILALEAEVEVSGQLAAVPTVFEKEYKDMQRDAVIEEEIKRLKGNMSIKVFDERMKFVDK